MFHRRISAATINIPSTPKISSVQEQFNQQPSPTVWHWDGGVSFSGGVLTVPGDHTAMFTQDGYDFTNDAVSVELVSGITNEFGVVGIDGTGGYLILKTAGGALRCEARNAGAYGDGGAIEVPYNATNHRWLFITHTGSQVLFQAAATYNGTKSTLRTSPLSTVDASSVRYKLQNNDADTSVWDNINSALASGSSQDLITRSQFGVFAYNEPYPTQPHFDLETTIGQILPIHSWFQNWSGGWNGTEAAKVAAAGGNRTIMVCWEPSGITLQNITNGQYDSYITSYITVAKAYGGPVVLRPMHEMNGSWYDWAPGSGRATAGSPATYIAAWRHMVDVARAVNAPNVRFFWCANGNDANSNGVTAEACYPGTAWVDIVGFDAYSWSYEGFRSFDDIMAPMYNRVTALHATAPVWIGETSVDRTGHPNFYTQAYTSQLFPRMKAVCWFSSGPDGQGNDFRIATSQADIDIHNAQLARMSPILP